MKTLREILDTKFPPRIWLFKNLLVESTLNLLYGPSDVGKSWFALRLVESWLTGEKFRWWKPSLAGGKTAIYYSLEDDNRQFSEDRARLLSIDIADSLNVETELRIESPGDVLALKDAIIRKGAGLVVIDNLLSVKIGNRDLNKNQEMKVFMEALRQLSQETGACILVVHHTGKESARSKAYAAAADETDVDTTAPLGATALFALSYTRIYLTTETGPSKRVSVRGKGIPPRANRAVFEDREWRLSNKDPEHKEESE